MRQSQRKVRHILFSNRSSLIWDEECKEDWSLDQSPLSISAYLVHIGAFSKEGVSRNSVRVLRQGACDETANRRIDKQAN